MGWYILGFVVLFGVFATGFFVGGKHKERAMGIAGRLKDTVVELKDTIGKKL